MGKLLQADTPSAQEMGRFFKLMLFLQKYLKEDATLVKLVEEKIMDDIYFKGDSTLLAQDFYWCCGRDAYAIEKY